MRAAAALVALLLLAAPVRAPCLPSSILVVCDDDYPPYAMRRADGQLEGIVPDLWKAWEKETGIGVELRGMSWAKALEEASAGRADVIDMLFETPSRRLEFELGPPYAAIQVPVFIHKSVSGIASAQDLAGFTVAVKSGDASIDELVARGVDDLKLYKGYAEIVEAAARLEVRIFCVDKPPAYYYLYKNKVDDEFRVAFLLGRGEFHRAVPKGRSDVLRLVEEGFKSLPSSTAAAIDWKWRGSELAGSADLRVISVAAAIIGCIVAFLVMNSWALGRRVRAATADLNRKISQLEESEARNRASLAEKEVLLKEIHHRVKNNLQIVSSLIQLKSEELRDRDDRLLLVDIRQRILALAQLHELLYQSKDLSSIDAGEYLDAIVRDTARAFAWPDIGCSVERVVLGIDDALPLGLVADELLVNAMKYAYPSGEKGGIRLALSGGGPGAAGEGPLVLRVEDDGVGLPPGVDPASCASMGFTIVRGLAQQLYGELRFGGPPGFSVELRVPRGGARAAALRH